MADACAVGNPKVHIVVSALFKEQVGGITSTAGIILHHRLGSRITVEELTIEPYVTAIEFSVCVEREMSNHVVGLQSVLTKGLGITDSETSILRLVIQILRLVARLIYHEHSIIHGLIVANRLHTHVDIMGIDCLKAAELVARSKDKITIMLIGHMIHANHCGACDCHGIILAGILADDTDKLAVRILYLVRLVANVKRHLLEAVVVFYISSRGHLGIDAYFPFAHRETGLEKDIAGIVLLIHAEQIVTADQKLHIGIGQHELVIIVVDIGCLAWGIVIDVGIIKAAHILALDQLRRLPIGIAVSDAVAQIVNVIIDIVEVNYQEIITVHHEHRRDVHVACQAHLEGTHVVVKDVGTCIHLALSHHGKHHQACAD